MTGEENKRKWRIGPSKDEKRTLKLMQISEFLSSPPLMNFFRARTRTFQFGNVDLRKKLEIVLRIPPESVGDSFENYY